MQAPNREFSISTRVYIEDTDAGGVVFYASYLRFMERARTEALRARGVSLGEWQDRHRRLFVVRTVHVDYLAPARLDDVLTVFADITTIKRASLVCEQPILAGDRKLVEATVRLACIDADTLAPVAIPGKLLERIHNMPFNTVPGGSKS